LDPPLGDGVPRVLSRHPRFGEIAGIGGRVGGLVAVPPAGSRGRAPGQGVEAPPPLRCHRHDFDLLATDCRVNA